MTIFTIGFTKKPAELFFTRLRDAGVRRLVDVRLNNISQLAGFTKKNDLRFFTKEICGIDYAHVPDLAPTADILYRWKEKDGWPLYERSFLELMRARAIETAVPRELVDGGCLLCSEESPQHCHRRLVAEYLQEKWGDVRIEHLP